MKIREISQKEDMVSISNAPFLQSWEWKSFQEQVGKRGLVLGVERDGKCVGHVFGFFHSLPMKKYLYIPRGPVFVSGLASQDRVLAYEALLRYLQINAKKYDILFARIEPLELREEKDTFLDVCKNFGLKFCKVHFIQPSDTLVIDVTQTPEALLEQMHPKTRYNIRLAEKKGVQARISGGEELETVWQLLSLTARRQHIRTHPKNYYATLLTMFGNMPVAPDSHLSARCYIAEYENTPIACHLMLGFGNTMTYLHGGTSGAYRNVMAPYLLHWRAMLDAKQAGFSSYDLYGIAPAGDAESHQLASVTRHKRGYGGREVNYTGTYEVILNPLLYRFYDIGKKLKNCLP